MAASIAKLNKQIQDLVNAYIPNCIKNGRDFSRETSGKRPGNVRICPGFVRFLSGKSSSKFGGPSFPGRIPDKSRTNPDKPRRNSPIGLNPSRKISRMKSRKTRGKILHESGSFPASFPFQPFSFSFFVQVLMFFDWRQARQSRIKQENRYQVK
jgi:hypothetical protein